MPGYFGEDKWHDDMIRVVVCDDAALLRRRLVVLLEAEPDLDVMAETMDGEHAISVSRELAPDVVILGLRVDFGGPRTVAGIREVVPSAHVIAIVTHEDEEDSLRAIKAGATGFLNRDAYQQVAAVVRAVSAGIVVLPPLVAKRILAEYDLLQPAEGPAGATLAPPTLLDRERFVLTKLSQGMTYRASAEDLAISDHAARNLAANAVEKLYRFARTSAVAYAVGERLFQDS